MEIPWQKLFYQNNADIYVWKRTTFQEMVVIFDVIRNKSTNGKSCSGCSTLFSAKSPLLPCVKCLDVKCGSCDNFNKTVYNFFIGAGKNNSYLCKSCHLDRPSSPTASQFSSQSASTSLGDDDVRTLRINSLSSKPSYWNCHPRSRLAEHKVNGERDYTTASKR